MLRNLSAGSQDFAVRHGIPFVSRRGDGVGLQDPHALALLAVILIEAAMLSEAVVRVAAWWEYVNSVQFSYLAGFFARRTLEQTGYSLPPVKIPRSR